VITAAMQAEEYLQYMCN